MITADVVKPYPDRPTEGFVQFNVEFTRMASETFEVGVCELILKAVHRLNVDIISVASPSSDDCRVNQSVGAVVQRKQSD